MSKSNAWESDQFRLLFNATPVANVADNAASGPLTQLWVALHTADPGEAGTQSTSETAYPGYGRIAVARTTGGWTISGTDPTQAANAATVQFAQCGVGTAGPLITHVTVGAASSGAGKYFYRAPLAAALAIANLIRPVFDPGTIVFNED